MSGVAEAIKAAQEAAKNIVDAEVTQETLPATSNGSAPPIVNYAKPSMDTLGQSNGISNIVSTWLKVDEFGLSIGTDRKKFESVIVEIDMTEDVGFMTKESIKWGNPVNYASRYAGMVSDKGEPWAEVVARANRVDSKAKVFPSADLILIVTQDIPQGTKDKPAPAITRGTKMGLGLAMSNWQNWVEFYKEVVAAGKLNTVVRAELSAVEVNGKNGYTWGVVGFKLVD